MGRKLDLKNKSKTLANNSIIFDVSLTQLQNLMELRGTEAVEAINKDFQGIKGLLRSLNVRSNDGINPESEIDRGIAFGVNEIPLKPSKSIFVLMWEALQDVTLIILIIAAMISLGLSLYIKYFANNDEDDDTGWIESVAIMGAVIVVVLVVSFNDWQKERQFQGLQQKVEDAARVHLIRNSEIILVHHKDIVVGDICLIKYGDVVPADGVIIQCSDLTIDESSLTGESDHVLKSPTTDPIILSSSRVMEGSGRMVVIAVGVSSQAGIIFGLLQNNPEDDFEDVESVSKVSNSSKPSNTESKEKSILQNKLTLLAIQIGYAGTFVALVTVMILIVSYITTKFIQQHKPWDTAQDIGVFVDFFIIGVTVLVVAVPEGLPLAVTISLAYSVKKMMNDNNLVRHLDACETMGNATSICSDKTGTLTTNRMTAVKYFIMGRIHSTFRSIDPMPEDLIYFLTVGIVVNCTYSTKLVPSEKPGGLVNQMGNKTECALLGFVQLFSKSIDQIRKTFPEESLFKVYTFNSLRKSMSTVVELPDQFQLFTKGASELLLNKCKWIITREGKLKMLTEDDKNNIMNTVILAMASEGLRTILLAYKIFIKGKVHSPNHRSAGNVVWENEEDVHDGLTCYAIIGIEDPVRPEVPDAIAKCQKAGITVRMVTGDNINTARSIALKCGIISQNDGFDVFDSKQFNEKIRDPKTNAVNQEKFDLVYQNLRVLARSSPQDKYNLVNGIINSYHNQNREIVAVTGDGTNDGPALKKADVGFAMGIAGTDVAKEASDIILTDDNFNSIVKAVMWGRNVYDSITKFLQFQLTVNVVAIIIAFVGACFISDSPLKAIQMLWVNLIMDTLASLALSTEIPSEELLDRAPYGRTSSLINKTMIKNIVGHAIYQIFIIIGLLFFGDRLLLIDNGQMLQALKMRGPNKHFTVIFNSFVLMTLFNEFNARKIHGQRNVFSGLHRNPIFFIIWGVTIVSQFIIVQFGGYALSTVALDLNEWLWCLSFGIGGLIWSQLIVTIPDTVVPTMNFTNKLNENNTLPAMAGNESVDSSLLIGQVLWLKGLKRIQSQMLVVNAFRYGIERKSDDLNLNYNNLRRRQRQLSRLNSLKKKLKSGDNIKTNEDQDNKIVI